MRGEIVQSTLREVLVISFYLWTISSRYNHVVYALLWLLDKVIGTYCTYMPSISLENGIFQQRCSTNYYIVRSLKCPDVTLLGNTVSYMHCTTTRSDSHSLIHAVRLFIKAITESTDLGSSSSAGQLRNDRWHIVRSPPLCRRGQHGIKGKNNSVTDKNDFVAAIL